MRAVCTVGQNDFLFGNIWDSQIDTIQVKMNMFRLCFFGHNVNDRQELF